ncbi:MAG: AsmA-like C-terminal region-containing protein [Vicinamibacterales bacterium]
MKYARWPIVIVAGVLVGLLIAVRVTSRAPLVRNKLISALDRELDADVTLQSLDVKIFPRLRIHGSGLTLRLHNQQQPAPLIHINEFEVAGGIFGMLRRQHRFSYVELHGLQITIPPKAPHGGEPAAGTDQNFGGPVLIDHLLSDNAQLVLVPNDSRKPVKIFTIHHLEMESVGFKRALPFRATLTNPIPRGEVQTTGTFGPWVADDPGATPIDGSYDFKHADLSTIHGIGGTLDSTGQFGGELDQIDVRGTTRTPDFQVTGAGLPVPLDTRFHVLVDGTNGDTYLKEIEATLGKSELTASGGVLATPGVKGRTVTIDADVKHGRLEDVLRVAVDNPRPAMTGSISLQTSIVLPPGKEDVADRLQLDGQFVLGDARFTDRAVQEKVVMLSRRSRGNPDGAGRVFTDMRGKFTLKDSRVHFDPLTFNVPGAGIHLSGRYGLRTGRIDFDGTMAMDASISKAAGGWKGLLLKPFDPLFRHNGSGAVLPIHIQGTRKHPKFGVDWKHALGGW